MSRTRTYAAAAWLMEAGGLKLKPADSRRDGQLLPAEVKTLLDSAVGPEVYTRDEPLREQILAHCAFNLHRMIDMARWGPK